MLHLQPSLPLLRHRGLVVRRRSLCDQQAGGLLSLNSRVRQQGQTAASADLQCERVHPLHLWMPRIR